jgi:hypothetical protein
MRRRLPSPALVIASAALFVALAGAGAAAGLALVWSPRSNVVVSGSVTPDGKLIGGLSHGTEKSTGVYTITVNGTPFAPSKAVPHPLNIQLAVDINAKGVTTIPPPACAIASQDIDSNGGATAEVDCFAYDPASGWQPADAGFDFQMVGPSR